MARLRILVFLLSTFLAAFLLFLVQPILGKVLLPWYGGSPGVWTTSMLVFQLLLFCGYVYSYVVTTHFKPVTQAVVHSILVFAALLLIPVQANTDWKELANQQPALSIVMVLLTTISLPFLLLSTTGPLMQAWFSRAFPGKTPYWLYAVSNTGSLIALISYPFLIEPQLRTVDQLWGWSGLFVLFSVLCVIVAIGSAMIKVTMPATIEDKPAQVDSNDLSLSRSLIWFLLAMLPSGLMLATTNQLCMDLAPIPFLVLTPLTLYLLSFILCFDGVGWYSRGGYGLAFMIAATLTTMASLQGYTIPFSFQFIVLSSTMFIGAMICHGELYRLKPDPAHLGRYYLMMSAGGAAGGLFVGVVAPFLFDDYIEFPLIYTSIFFVLAFIGGAAAVAGQTQKSSLRQAMPLLLIAVVNLGGVGLHEVLNQKNCIARERNFFGTIRVTDDGDTRRLFHGRVSHGCQFSKVEDQHLPTTYYGHNSGIGLALRTHKVVEPRKVGVIGMGVGTLAVYGKPEDEFHFYEIDKDVVRVANENFTFLKNSGCKVITTLGDARVSLEDEARKGIQHEFDVLAVDAFSSDAIPIHLLTREAFEGYLHHVCQGGILAFHISHNHLDFKQVIAAHVQAKGLHAKIVVSEGKIPLKTHSSIWALISREPDVLQVAGLKHLPELKSSRLVEWTDDFSSVIAALDMRKLGYHTSSSPDDLSPAYKEGQQALNDGDLKLAETQFRDAISQNDSESVYWLALGNTLRKQNRRDEALTSYERGLELNPTGASLHNNLAMLLLESDPKRAEEHVRHAIESDYQNAEAYNNLAILQTRRGELKSAIENYQTALILNPELVSARENMTQAQKLMGE